MSDIKDAFTSGLASSAASSLVGGISQSLFSRLNAGWQLKQYKKYAEIQDEYAKRAFDRSADFSREMYSRQYQDQLPATVRKNLIDAGLNPALFFANGQNGSSAAQVLSAQSSPAVGEAVAPMFPSSPSIGGESSSLMDAQKTNNTTPTSADFTEQFNAKTRELFSSAGHHDAQSSLLRYDESYRRLTQDTNVATLKASLRNIVLTGNQILADTALIRQKFRTELFNTKVMSQTADNLKLQYNKIAVDIAEGILRTKIHEYELTDLLPAQYNLFRAQTFKAFEEGATEATRRLLFHSQMDMNDSLRDYYRSKASETPFHISETKARTAKLNAETKWMPIMNTYEIINGSLNTINQYIRTFRWSPGKGSKDSSSPTIKPSDINSALEVSRMIEGSESSAALETAVLLAK